MELNKQEIKEAIGKGWISYGEFCADTAADNVYELIKEKLSLYTIDVDYEEGDVCDHEYHHEHTNWYKCIKCGYVTSF